MPSLSMPSSSAPAAPAPPPQTPQFEGGLKPGAKAESLEDLKYHARGHGIDKNADGIPDAVSDNFKLPQEDLAKLNFPRQRIEGMLPIEHNTKRTIDQVIASLGASTTQGEARQKEIRAAVSNLRSMRDGMRAQNSVSDAVYQAMGMPEIYVKEQREGFGKSIERLDAAVRQLQGK